MTRAISAIVRDNGAMPSNGTRPVPTVLRRGAAAASLCWLACPIEVPSTAFAGEEPPVLCRALDTSPLSVVTITPNTTGECRESEFSPVRECRPDQAMHVEVEWQTPPTERAYVVQCTLANPESTQEDGYDCLPNVPAGSLVQFWKDEAYDSAGATVYAQVNGAYQQSGQSHPGRSFTQIVVDSIPYLLTRAEYCDIIARSPDTIPPGLEEYALERCCRDFYDIFVYVDPAPAMTKIRFDLVAPLPDLGHGDWRFVTPRCGDEVRSCGEQCDDGGTAAYDGCSPTCGRERCGMPHSPSEAAKPTATDARVVLRAAVGSVPCDVCVCDADGSGGVSASDALRVLRVAVGIPGTLECGDCIHQHNTTADWDPYVADGQFFFCGSKCGLESDIVHGYCSGFEREGPVFGCCSCAESDFVIDTPYQCMTSPSP